MRRFTTAVTLTAAGLLLPAALPAQSQQAICERIAILEPGEWVVYEMTGQAGLSWMRIANVGDEEIDGTTYHRYEMEFEATQGTMTTQILTSGRVFDMDKVREMVMQIPGQPPMRVSGDMLQASPGLTTQPRVIADERCREATSVGRETLTVPAGSIRALHIQTNDGDHAWITADVPGAMVKATTAEGVTVMLAGHGTGAKSSM